jgi:hypothetical protein
MGSSDTEKLQIKHLEDLQNAPQGRKFGVSNLQQSVNPSPSIGLFPSGNTFWSSNYLRLGQAGRLDLRFGFESVNRYY